MGQTQCALSVTHALGHKDSNCDIVIESDFHCILVSDRPESPPMIPHLSQINPNHLEDASGKMFSSSDGVWCKLTTFACGLLYMSALRVAGSE